MFDWKPEFEAKIVEDKPAGKMYIPDQSMEGVREVDIFQQELH